MSNEINIEKSAGLVAQWQSLSYQELNRQFVVYCISKDLQLAHTYHNSELGDISGLCIQQVSYKNWSQTLDLSHDLQAALMLITLQTRLCEDDGPLNQADKKIWSDHWTARKAMDTPKMMVQRMSDAMHPAKLQSPSASKASMFAEHKTASQLGADSIAHDDAYHPKAIAIKG